MNDKDGRNVDEYESDTVIGRVLARDKLGEKESGLDFKVDAYMMSAHMLARPLTRITCVNTLVRPERDSDCFLVALLLS